MHDAKKDGNKQYANFAVLSTISHVNTEQPSARVIKTNFLHGLIYFKIKSTSDLRKDIKSNPHIALTWTLLSSHFMRSIVVHGVAARDQSTHKTHRWITFIVKPYYYKFSEIKTKNIQFNDKPIAHLKHFKRAGNTYKVIKDADY